MNSGLAIVSAFGLVSSHIMSIVGNNTSKGLEKLVVTQSLNAVAKTERAAISREKHVH